jgi:hypothetical protein
MGRCGWRMIRESKDLPENMLVIFRKRSEQALGIWAKKGYPRSITKLVWGFFIFQTVKEWRLS